MGRRPLEDDEGAAYVPTPHQLREAIREVQALWTPKQEYARRCITDSTVEIRRVCLADVRAAKED